MSYRNLPAGRAVETPAAEACNSQPVKRIPKAIPVCAAALLLAGLLWIFVPAPSGRQAAALARVEAACSYAVPLSGTDTLYLPVKSGGCLPASLRAAEVADTVNISGVFVSRQGHLLTTDSLLLRMPDTLAAAPLRARLQEADTLLARRARLKGGKLRELDAYARIHSVVDDGYNEVMAYRAQVARELSSLGAVREKVQQALRLPAAQATLQGGLRIFVPADSAVYQARRVARQDGLVLVQASGGILPPGAARFSVYRWGCYAYRPHLWAFNDFGGPTSGLQPSRLEAADTLFAATEGGAWVNASGNLCGIRRGKGRVSSAQMAALLAEVRSWPAWWWNNLKAFALSLTGELPPPASRLKGREGAPLPCRRMSLPGGAVYEGQVRFAGNGGRAERQGYGRLTCPEGTVVQGWWQADTLTYGLRTDSAGVYRGSLDSLMLPEGFGEHWATGGEYYQGGWRGGLRHGHGFSSQAGQMVNCGAWSKGRFKGERLVYTEDRIYGIDISRHQHEKGRKRYGIRWDDLRITSLGPGRRVQGKVDYPVSFVYIKSTEGRTVYNRYYAEDRRQARRRGIAVGTYHFFSTASTGAAQAAHFLRRSFPASDALPPVLDLEPTEAQIKRMGGDKKMFREVKVWLETVEKRSGRRPILYVSQQFVNNHLNHAPEALREYDVWVARYGEFKPYVHLLHWQLTPYGRVRGITGEVDINIFNGTSEQFGAYLKRQKPAR